MTVLMPVYNAEKFLKEAIDSVLSQTFKDFEFLIIDDGSTDRSVPIINSYKDKRIRFFRNSKNIGITETLNKGIMLADAKLIARMDSDDICHLDRLQKQYDFILANPDGALYTCWANEVDEDLNFLNVSYYNPNHFYHSLTFSCWIYHPTMIFRKDAVISIGKYTMPYSEDFELAWQLSRKYKIYHLPEILLEYRNSSQSLWQVTKKTEYKNSFINQVRRNIIYYIENSSEISLDDYKLEILSYYYDSSRRFNVQEILSALKLQAYVTNKMIEKENPNRDVPNIKSANEEKTDFIISLFLPSLPFIQGIHLLLFAGRVKKIPVYISKKIKIFIYQYIKRISY